MQFIHKYICGIIAILLLSYFFYTKDFKNKYDKVIMAEGTGYYAYLPATFIYHDYSFEFFNKIYPRYYNPGGLNPPTNNFINWYYTDIKVDKYYPGVSLLWIPFFLIAHLLALLFHLPADGYSDIYQYAIGMAGIFYTWLGLKFLKKILAHFQIVPAIQSFALLAIVFGTNLLMYAACWSSQTHCYSFFAIAAFCRFVIQLKNERREKVNYALCMCFIFLALIISIRPQNGIILLTVPLFGFTQQQAQRLFRQHLFSVISITGIFIAAAVLFRVCWYWYVQTGKFFLNPYYGEHYYLNNPHTLDALFSFRKGWLLYTPFAAIGLAGIFFFRTLRERITLILFWSILIYITSCWWSWTFSPTSFGQRPYVDFYCLIALQAAVLFSSLRRKPLRSLLLFIAGLMIPLNLLQTYQYKSGIIDGNYYYGEVYWKNFFKTSGVAYYPIPPSTIIDNKTYTLNFDEAQSTMPRTDKVSYSKLYSSYVCSTNEFSGGQKVPLPAFITNDEFSRIRVTAMIKANELKSCNANLVIDINRNGKSIQYSAFSINPFIQNTKWREFQAGVIVPSDFASGDSVSVYFWRPQSNGSDTLYIDDLKIELIHMNRSYENKR
jgi:hypothetical protein